MQRYVVFYESADDVMSKAPPVYPRHLARLKAFRDDPFVNEGVVKSWTLREWDEVAREI